MNFETLKKDNKKKYMLGLIIVSAIVVTITYIGTRAKYRVTNSAQLASGVINYSPSDLELVAIKVQNDSNEYDNSDTVPTSGYTLNKELSVCKVGETKQDVTITYENGKVRIVGITTKGTKCQLYFDMKKIPLKEAILVNNTIDTSRSSGHFESTFEEDTSGRIFSAEDDDGTTYFFAGSNPNNWVKFGKNTSNQDLYWRIIRINGDESIRMIYNGPTTAQTGETTQIEKSVFNSSHSDNAYEGYMYGTPGSSTYVETHANNNSSTIKTYIDTWYEENLKTNYEQYIDLNAGFCGDRGLATGTGIGTINTEYSPENRVFIFKTATYKCRYINDLYTLNSSSKGNKALVNPIGLITSDEVMYAGGYKEGTQNHWLKTEQNYWTMSPYYFYGTNAFVHIINSDGFVYADFVAYTNGTRPVINLKANVLITGSGTTSDPYRIVE